MEGRTGARGGWREVYIERGKKRDKKKGDRMSG